MSWTGAPQRPRLRKGFLNFDVIGTEVHPMRATLCAIVLGGILVSPSFLRAHHAFYAVFDASKSVTLRGKVTKVEWNNPHAWIYIDIESPDGEVVNWAVEAGSPNALVRRGWKKTSLPIGAEVIVDGYLAKDGTPTANGRDVMLPDGRKMFVGSPGAGGPALANDEEAER